MRCNAAFTWRLPPRLRRCRVLLEDQTGIGAVHIPPSKCRSGSETSRAGDLANDLRSLRSSPQPGSASSVGASRSHQAADLVRKLIGTLVQRPTTCHQFARNICYGARYVSKTIVEYTEHRFVPQALGRDLHTREKLVQVPA